MINPLFQSFKQLNTVPKDDKGLPEEKFCRVLKHIHDSFLNKTLSNADEDKTTSQAAISVINKHFGKLPTFYIIQLPVEKTNK